MISVVEELIKEYREWVDKNIPIDTHWIEEINYLSHIRQEIHDTVKRSSNVPDYILEDIKKIDAAWQAYILKMVQNPLHIAISRVGIAQVKTGGGILIRTARVESGDARR